MAGTCNVLALSLADDVRGAEAVLELRAEPAVLGVILVVPDRRREKHHLLMEISRMKYRNRLPQI